MGTANYPPGKTTIADPQTASAGDTSPVVTPKDVSPDDAAAKDLIVRKVDSDDIEESEEALLDDAIELSFPASDPISIPTYEKAEELRAKRSSTRDPK